MHIQLKTIKAFQSSNPQDSFLWVRYHMSDLIFESKFHHQSNSVNRQQSLIDLQQIHLNFIPSIPLMNSLIYTLRNHIKTPTFSQNNHFKFYSASILRQDKILSHLLLSISLILLLKLQIYLWKSGASLDCNYDSGDLLEVCKHKGQLIPNQYRKQSNS